MKRLFLILMLAVLLISAAPQVKLVRLVIENQSDQPAFLKLNLLDSEFEFEYRFAVPAAGSEPFEQAYTVARGKYRVEALYCGESEYVLYELPVFGKETRHLIHDCNAKPPNPGGDGLFRLSPFLWESGNDEPYVYGKFTAEFRY